MPFPCNCPANAPVSPHSAEAGFGAALRQVAANAKAEAGRKAGDCVSESLRPASDGQKSTTNHDPCCLGRGFSGGTADCESRSRLPGWRAGESIRAAVPRPATHWLRATRLWRQRPGRWACRAQSTAGGSGGERIFCTQPSHAQCPDDVRSARTTARHRLHPNQISNP